MCLALDVTCSVDLMTPASGSVCLCRLADGGGRTRTFGMATERTAECDWPAPSGQTFHEL